MSKSLRIAVVQMNAIVGDLNKNRDKIIAGMQQAQVYGCDLVAFPELCITGYPPEDLVTRQQFILDQRKMLDEIIHCSDHIITVVGFVDGDSVLYNAAAVVQNRTLSAIYHKIQLPNYSVFDEERYFESGQTPLVLDIEGCQVGISICEDIWIEGSVTETEAIQGGAEILLNLSASPYAAGKIKDRINLLNDRSRFCRAFVVYTNLVGGQDELVFDGSSMILNPEGDIVAMASRFDEDFMAFDIDLSSVTKIRNETSYREQISRFHSPFPTCRSIALSRPKLKQTCELKPHTFKHMMPEEEEIYSALILGLRDYVVKNGFQHVVLGLSGGIDSALVAALAVDALGTEYVHGVTMPSSYSSSASIDDSYLLSRNLKIDIRTIPIEEILYSYLKSFLDSSNERKIDLTEENLQARIRGNIIMALSNKFGWLPLTTGNKSEVSVGYCTIYGDMAGGFAPLKDVMKTMVYRLARYRNQRAGYDLIPQNIIEKAPSAELRPDQKDQDTLPPYEVLDQILELYIEKAMGIKEIIANGFDPAIVVKTTRWVDISEFKRRQAAPGTKITQLAFGKDRRMPITNHYHER